MANKLMNAGCLLGALIGLLSFWSPSTHDAQRIFRLSVAGLALALMLTGGVMMLQAGRKGRE